MLSSAQLKVEDSVPPIVTVIKPEKKKRVNGKKKGSGFENHISKLLSEKLDPLKFRRSQSSGAILGGENVKLIDQFSVDAKTLFIGDVVPTNEADVFREKGWKFKFTLECKFYQNPDRIDHLLDGSRIIHWYDQAAADASKLGKQPLLIFKFNHTEIFCALDASYKLPDTVRKLITLHDPADSDGVLIYKKLVHVFTLEEALKDLEWWKSTSDVVLKR